MKPGLSALLSPKPVSEFFGKAWPDQPFVVHGELARLRGLADTKELSSVEALAKVPCHAVLAQGQHLDAQRFGNIAVAPELAATLLGSGVSFYSFIDVEHPDTRRFPSFADIPKLTVTLGPGECLYIPAGWWHFVRSLSVSVSISMTNFSVPNAGDFEEPMPGASLRR